MRQEIAQKSAGQIIDDVISKIVLGMAVVAAILTFFMALAICYSIIGREFLKQDVAWVLELCEYLIYIDVMLATPWVLKIDKHVRVDIFYYLIPRQGQKILNQVINFLGIIMCSWFFYYSFNVVVEAYISGINLVRVIPVKKWIVMVFLPIMSLLCAIIFFRRFIVFAHHGFSTTDEYASFEEAKMNSKYSTKQSTELTLPDYDALPTEVEQGNTSDVNSNEHKKTEVF